MKCQVCEKEFESKRSDATTCSAACRKKKSRELQEAPCPVTDHAQDCLDCRKEGDCGEEYVDCEKWGVCIRSYHRDMHRI